MGLVEYVDEKGKAQVVEFKTEDEGKKIKQELRAKGIKGKFTW